LLIGTCLWIEHLRSDHPPAKAALEASLPSPGTPLHLRDRNAQAEFDLNAQLVSLRAVAFPPGNASTPAAPMEVRFRVPADFCRRLPALPSVACGGDKRLRPAAGFSIEWRRVRPIEMQIHRARSLAITTPAPVFRSAVPRSWTFESDAMRQRISFSCLRSVGFALVVSSQRMKSTCSSDGKPLRLWIDGSSTLYLDGLHFLKASGRGEHLAARADAGSMELGEREVPLVNPRERVDLQGASGGVVRFGIDAADGAGTGTFAAEADSVAAAVVGSEDRLPSRFEGERDVWIALAFAIGGLCLASVIAVLGGWIERRAAHDQVILD
jgi:hypothetical protein